MSRQSEAIGIVIEYLNAVCNVNIVLNPLPIDGGVCAEITGSQSKGRRLDINHGTIELTLMFMTKNISQNIAYEQLCCISEALNSYAGKVGETVQVMGAAVRSGPTLVANNKHYIYSLIAVISINY